MRAWLAIAVLVSGEALAGWSSTSTSGTPKDVTVTDGGVVVASSTEAVVVNLGADGGAARGQTLNGNFVSATWRGPYCLHAVTVGAVVNFDSSCGVSDAPFGNTAGRFRSTASGATYAYTANSSNLPTLSRLESNAGAVAGQWWTIIASPGTRTTNTYPISTVTLASGEEVVALQTQVNSSLNVYVDAGFRFSIPTSGFAYRDLHLFDNAGRVSAFAVDDGGSVLYFDDLLTDGGFVSLGTSPANFGVTFNATAGNTFGRGFGMIASGTQIFSPVPNPSAVGQVWIPRDAGFPAPLVRVSCRDARLCGAITNSATGQNIFVYSNDAKPSAEQLPVSIPQGTTIAYTLDAGDDDGDPIWVTWQSGGFTWDGGDPRVISITAPAGSVCGSIAGTPVQGMLSDGLAAHDTPFSIPVNITGMSVGAPVVSPGGLSFAAGGAQQSAQATPPTGTCAPTGLGWSLTPALGPPQVPDGGFVISVDGGFVFLTPPSHYCVAGGGTFSLTATAVGTPDASTTIPVQLSPWGLPEVPGFTPAVRSQLAGMNVTYFPDPGPGHVCENAPGYLGTLLVSSGNTNGLSGVSFSSTANSFTVTSLDACVDGTVDVTAHRRVNDVSAEVSAPASVRVDLRHDWKPIDATTSFDDGFTFDPSTSIASGFFSVATNCVASRDIVGQIQITGEDGGLAGARTVHLPDGGWSVTVQGACAGGRFTSASTVSDDGGSSVVLVHTFDAGAFAASVPALDTTRVPVSCDQGASATFAFDFQPSDCRSEDFTWLQTRGPGLLHEPSGSDLSFATRTHDLEAQAGQLVTWDVTGTIAPGNAITVPRSVLLEPTRFVEVTHRTSVPIAREEEALTVEVVIHNTTDCAVSGLTLSESLGGLHFVPETVRVEGVRYEPVIGTGGFAVADLSLGARGTTILTYQARAPLLSAATPSATIGFRGYDVTTRAGGLDRPLTGCGCDSSTSGVFALVVLAAAVMRARRRSR